MDDKSWARNYYNSILRGEGKTFIASYLNAGLDVNALKSDGQTVLSNAAQYGDLETVEYLLQKGANCNTKNADGSIPLHVAAKCCYADVVEYFYNLCEGKCDLNVQTSDGKTPLLLAAEYGRKDVLKLLIRFGSDVEFCDDSGWTMLHYACFRRWLDAVQFLVNKKCNLNVETSYGVTPLLLSGSAGRRDVVMLLVDAGADVAQCNTEDKWTVLHYASSHGWLEEVQALIRNGADLNAVNSNGETPLHIACKKWCLEIVNYLLEVGANCNVIDDYGLTPLHYACDREWLDLVRFLVNKKCNLNVKTKDGATPLSFAWAINNKDIVALLVESGADVEQCCNPNQFTLMHYACGREDWVEVVRTLIKNRTDLNAVNAIGEAPLHVACRGKCLEIIKHLLEAGVNWNLEDGDNVTAFYYCIGIAPSVEGIGLFVKNGAYFEDYELEIIYKNAFLKDPILKNIELCSQGIINKFNDKDLPTFYKLSGCGERLPPIERMRIVHGQSVANEIEKCVESDIFRRGYYNLKESCPTVLKLLSMKALIHYYN